jgi:hypothetical protein
MILHIDGEARPFTPIGLFRARAGLPAGFGVSLFLPRPHTPTAQLDGDALEQVRAATLDAVPTGTPPLGWTTAGMLLQRVFRRALLDVNGTVGLKPSELDFAVMGFAEMTQAALYQMLDARMHGRAAEPFARTYARWLDASVTCSHPFQYHPADGAVWTVRLVSTAYGVCGLIVTGPGATGPDAAAPTTDYLYDPARMCPAEPFMRALLADVAGRFARFLLPADAPT